MSFECTVGIQEPYRQWQAALGGFCATIVTLSKGMKKRLTNEKHRTLVPRTEFQGTPRQHQIIHEPERRKDHRLDWVVLSM